MKLRSSSKRQNEKTAMQTARRRVAGDGGTVPGVHCGPPGAWTWSCRCPRQALPTDTDRAPGRACPSPSGDQGNPARGQRALWPSFSPPPRPPQASGNHLPQAHASPGSSPSPACREPTAWVPHAPPGRATGGGGCRHSSPHPVGQTDRRLRAPSGHCQGFQCGGGEGSKLFLTNV